MMNDLDQYDYEHDAAIDQDRAEHPEDYGDDGGRYPIGELMACYERARLHPQQAVKDELGYPCVMRLCVELGPVVNMADPTQTYALECGHVSIA
jgi:hypothetical protein